jgi:hypothetical protein
MEVMNSMDTNIPEEIREKLKIIEKEAEFSQKMDPPRTSLVSAGIVLIVLAIFDLNEKEYFKIALYFLFGSFSVAWYFSYKKLYELHSNAHDIINYYKNKEEKKHNN